MQTQRTSSNFSVFGGNWNIRRVSLIALILGFVVLSGPQLLPAQDTVTKTQATRDRMYCYQKVLEPGSTGGGRVVVNGFTVEVKTVRDPDDPDYMTCKATIRSSEGKTVFEHADWGMEVEPITGKDVNGDGYADAVLSAFSGGAHCCSTYYVVSLGKNPALIAEFGSRSTATFEDLHGDGRVEILIRDGGFEGGFGLVSAFSPRPLLIVRLNGTRFEDVGSKFWPVFEKEIREECTNLNENTLHEFLQSDPAEIDDTTEHLEAENHILMIALDYLYAGRASESRDALRKLWPEKDQERVWAQMLRGYCSGLRTELKLEMGSACKPR